MRSTRKGASFPPIDFFDTYDARLSGYDCVGRLDNLSLEDGFVAGMISANQQQSPKAKFVELVSLCRRARMVMSIASFSEEAVLARTAASRTCTQRVVPL